MDIKINHYDKKGCVGWLDRKKSFCELPQVLGRLVREADKVPLGTVLSLNTKQLRKLSLDDKWKLSPVNLNDLRKLNFEVLQISNIKEGDVGDIIEVLQIFQQP
jgi:hypothetical protein